LTSLNNRDSRWVRDRVAVYQKNVIPVGWCEEAVAKDPERYNPVFKIGVPIDEYQNKPAQILSLL